MKLSVALNHTFIASGVLLGGLVHNGPALADSCPSPGFAAARTFDAGPSPGTVAIGDFNSDGKPDLAVANVGTYDSTGCQCIRNSSVSVLLGQGDGTFRDPKIIRAGARSVSVAVGDFNGDTQSDLAVANEGTPPGYTDGNVSMLLCNGDGTFQSAVDFFAGQRPRFVAAGDFNRDDKPDLAVANSGDSLSILLGNGDGTFRPADRSVTLQAPGSVAVGDFNGDGKLDLAVTVFANIGFANFVSVLLGNGDGTFANSVNYTTRWSGGARSVAVGDFDGDDKPDLAVHTGGAAPDDGLVSVLLSKGDGTFRSAINAPLPTNRENYRAGTLALADFNGDGKLDVTVGERRGAVSLLLGKGDGTFQKILNFGVGSATSLAVGDFNGDSKPDLIATSTYVTVLLNTCASSGAGLSTLRINDTVRISWPVSSTGAVLESTSSLSLTNWQSVVETPTTNNGRLEISIRHDQAERYFRLRQ